MLGPYSVLQKDLERTNRREAIERPSDSAEYTDTLLWYALGYTCGVYAV